MAKDRLQGKATGTKRKKQADEACKPKLKRWSASKTATGSRSLLYSVRHVDGGVPGLSRRKPSIGASPESATAGKGETG